MIFMIIYTIEMVLKIIAHGFVTQEHSYLRDGWNILDFTICGCSWLIFLVGANNISVIRTIRVLRTLRTLELFPELAKLVEVLIQIIPKMANVCFLCMIFIIVFACISM